MPAISASLAAPHEWMAALRVLFGRGSDADRAAAARVALEAEREPAGLFVARADGGVCGAMLAQALPGALGVVWPPRAEAPEAAEALVPVACEWLRARGVKVCQAFGSADELSGAAALARLGFRHVTQLVSMRRAVTLPPDRPTGALAFRPHLPPLGEEFRDALLATHEGTLDCPELNGERTAEELLAGLTEPVAGTAWYLASAAGAAVGVVILAAGPEPEVAELSYLGVVPAARGRGVGGELVRFSLTAAALAGRAALAVSVDARNEPAIRLYRRHGFTEGERREVFLASWGSGVVR